MDGDLKPWKDVRTPGETEVGGTTRERNEALPGSKVYTLSSWIPVSRLREHAHTTSSAALVTIQKWKTT